MGNLLSKKRDHENTWPNSVKSMDIQGVISFKSPKDSLPFHLEHISDKGIDVWVSSVVEKDIEVIVKFSKPSIVEAKANILWCIPLESGGFKIRLEVSNLENMFL